MLESWCYFLFIMYLYYNLSYAFSTLIFKPLVPRCSFPHYFSPCKHYCYTFYPYESENCASFILLFIILCVFHVWNGDEQNGQIFAMDFFFFFFTTVKFLAEIRKYISWDFKKDIMEDQILVHIWSFLVFLETFKQLHRYISRKGSFSPAFKYWYRRR